MVVPTAMISGVLIFIAHCVWYYAVAIAVVLSLMLWVWLLRAVFS